MKTDTKDVWKVCVYNSSTPLLFFIKKFKLQNTYLLTNLVTCSLTYLIAYLLT